MDGIMLRIITVLIFLAASVVHADPPGQNTSFSNLESQAYNEIEVRLEETFYKTDRVLYNELRDTLIKDGVRVYQQELRYRRSRLESLAREKPNTAREAININLSYT